MPTMADAVNPDNLAGLDVAAVTGYIDGPESKWPADAWGKFSVPAMRISVLADPDALAFDVEPGNAPAATVSRVHVVRALTGAPTVIYVGTATVSKLRVNWLPPSAWPAPGAYLWAAYPGDHPPGEIPAWCPVRPVAVQDRYPGPYDLSTLIDGWLPVIGAPAPQPHQEDDMQLYVTNTKGQGFIVAPDFTSKVLVPTGDDAKALLGLNPPQYVNVPAGALTDGFIQSIPTVP